jgi:hypothetical protein
MMQCEMMLFFAIYWDAQQADFCTALHVKETKALLFFLASG